MKRLFKFVQGAGVGDDHPFQSLCREAVLACGDDLDAIRRFVEARLASMDEASRRQVTRDVEQVLAFNPPDRSIWEQ